MFLYKNNHGVYIVEYGSSRQNNASQRHPPPNPWNLWILAYVVKATLRMWLKILRREDYRALPSNGRLPWNHKGSCKSWAGVSSTWEKLKDATVFALKMKEAVMSQRIDCL